MGVESRDLDHPLEQRPKSSSQITGWISVTATNHGWHHNSRRWRTVM